jgi:YVTN family beta-propeller protein
VHGHPATQGKGVMPDGTSRFSIGKEMIHHYMGCSTFSNFTVLPEIAVAKIREDAPFDKVCYIGCGVTTGIGAVIHTAKVEPGANVVVFGLGGIGLNVVQGAKLAGANKIVGVDINPKRKALAEKFGMTHFVNPKEVKGDLVAHLVELTNGGADYSFECIGNVELMRQALECCHRGWGEIGHHRRRRRRQGDHTRPFQLVTGRVWKGSAFGGARGRTGVPQIVDWYMDGKINIDDLITHTMPLEKINDAFELMHTGESIRSVVSRDDRIVYTACETSNQVYVVDARSMKVVATIPTAARPRSVLLSGATHTGYVTDEFGASLTVFSTMDYKVLRTIALGDPKVVRPMGVVASADGRLLYVTTGRAGAVLEIDPQAGTILRTFEAVGKRPWGLALSRDGHKVYTANGPAGDISVVDLAGGRVDKRISVGGSPWGIVSATAPLEH